MLLTIACALTVAQADPNITRAVIRKKSSVAMPEQISGSSRGRAPLKAVQLTATLHTVLPAARMEPRRALPASVPLPVAICFRCGKRKACMGCV